ncbi:MAG: ABC transporter permease [Clostridiales bacterium]|nr:ABC transporter permease [Clostridiales bacterium]
MQVFKAFFKILNKNKTAMIVYMVIYLALTFVLSSNGQKNDTSDFSKVCMEIGVENQDNGKLGEALVAYLEKENEIKDIPKEREDLLDAMYYRDIQYVLIIPEDFTEKFLAGEREEVLEGTAVPGNNTAYLAKMEIDEFLQKLGMYIDGGYEPEQAAQKTLDNMEKESKVEFLSVEDSGTKPAAAYFFDYIPYIFLCIMMVSLSCVLIIFNEKNLDARNRCSSMSFFQRNLQMVLGSLGIMLLEYGVFMLVAWIMYPNYMGSFRGILSMGNALAFMLVCLSIAFLAGRQAKDDAQLNMAANVIGLAFSFLGGVFVPIDLMNKGMQKVAKFVPSYWYVSSNNSIWKIKSLSEAGDIYRNWLIMLAFAIAVFAIALMMNRLKARKS